MDPDRIKGYLNEIGGEIEGAVGKVIDDPGVDIEGRTREAAGTAQHLYSQAKDTAQSLVSQASDQLSEAYDRGSNLLQKGNLSERVTANPLGALLVAGAAGYLLAYYMHSHRPPPPVYRWPQFRK